MIDKLKPLIIGDLKIEIPIIQGGMGVKVSTASLASAVSNCKAAGTIASVGLAYGADESNTTYVQASREALVEEIRKTRSMTDGVFGVNIMVALSNYEDMVRASADENVDFIISGAGMPLSLPEYTEGSSVKLIPIVSSTRALQIILKTWKRRYNRMPDAIIVEGPMAGGHLGYRLEDLRGRSTESLDEILVNMLTIIKDYEVKESVKIPVIAAGGIFDGKDIARVFELGVQGVQMGTRFVVTEECDVPEGFKNLYINAKEEDVVILDSPVGMPGRAVKTEFVNRIMSGEKIPFTCPYQCLRSCDSKNVPYCIAKALCNAVKGDLDNAVVFAGANVDKITKIVPVKQLIDEVVTEAVATLREKESTA